MIELHIRTENEAHAVIGMDTTILPVPKGFYVVFNGERMIALKQLTAMLRRLSFSLAHNIDEKLHHADYVITTDPTVVESRGTMHDCDECRAGTRKAIRMMAEHPEMEVLVGSLYWSA